VDRYYYWWISRGLTLHLMGLPGEVAYVDKVHDPGRISLRQTPAMIVASLFSLQLVAVLDQKLRLYRSTAVLRLVRVRSQADPCYNSCADLCGMSAALGAFFGAPLVAHSLPWNSCIAED